MPLVCWIQRFKGFYWMDLLDLISLLPVENPGDANNNLLPLS